MRGQGGFCCPAGSPPVPRGNPSSAVGFSPVGIHCVRASEAWTGGASGSRRVTAVEPEAMSRGQKYRHAQPDGPGLVKQPLRWSLILATSGSEYEVNTARRCDHKCVEEQCTRCAREKLCRAAEAESHAASGKPADVLRARVLAKRQAWTARAVVMEQTGQSEPSPDCPQSGGGGGR